MGSHRDRPRRKGMTARSCGALSADRTAARRARVNMMVYTPAKASRPVPLILLAQFRRRSAGAGRGRDHSSPIRRSPPTSSARGWGYAMVGYQDIQPDRPNTFNQGVIGTTLRPGRSSRARRMGDHRARGRGASAESSTTSRPTSWSTRRRSPSRDTRASERRCSGPRLMDERIAAVYSSCSGEMGAALARRDWGETVDDMAQNFPYRFAGNFQNMRDAGTTCRSMRTC